jgi:hypothetical protein
MHQHVLMQYKTLIMKSAPWLAVIFCCILGCVCCYIILILIGEIPVNIKWPKKYVSMQLNTSFMIEADTALMNNNITVIEVYSCDKENTSKDSIPWADVYVAKIHSYAKPSATADTVLFIDSNTVVGMDLELSPENYWVNVKPAPFLKKCKVTIPEKSIGRLNRYKYSYAKVQLAIDD